MKLSGAAHSSEPLPDERDLVRQAKAGDTEAFAQMYDAYVERLYRYIYFRVADDQTAEDLTSQVFLKAWENLECYQPGGSPFLAWLYTIARNAVIDHYRRHRQTVSLEEAVPLILDGDALDERIELRLETQSLRRAMHRLTEDQQQVLILKFIVGLSTAEIAHQMGKRRGAVRALQMRALRTLAKQMEE